MLWFTQQILQNKTKVDTMYSPLHTKSNVNIVARWRIIRTPGETRKIQSAKLHFYKDDEMMSMLDEESSIPAESKPPATSSQWTVAAPAAQPNWAYWNSLKFAQNKENALSWLQKPEW